MKNHKMMRWALALTVALFAALILAPSSSLADKKDCKDLPSYGDVTEALEASVGNNGGFDLEMWATVVNRDGIVCVVTFSGDDRGDQWPGSRVISAQKANTANAFSLPGLALSTANLWAATQPGGSLFGLQFSNPVDTAVAYGGSSHAGGNAKKYGTSKDPLVGDFIGGVNVFGGGLALYDSDGELLGAVGVSGDTSCADHNIAWRVRNLLGLDNVPAGVGAPGDNIIFDLADDAGGNPESAGGFGHPKCGGPGSVDGVSTDDAVDNATVVNDCPLGDGPTAGCGV